MKRLLLIINTIISIYLCYLTFSAIVISGYSGEPRSVITKLFIITLISLIGVIGMLIMFKKINITPYYIFAFIGIAVTSVAFHFLFLLNF